MDRSDAFSQLREAAVEVLHVDASAVTEDARFKEDLDADSLALIEFVMALVLLIFTAPLILFAMILIRVTSPGPAIYTQTRLGRAFGRSGSTSA